MKLTEQQLAQLFQHSKDTAVESVMDDFNEYSEASNVRLNALEEIANNSTFSASQHIINKMEAWSQAVATEIQAQTKPTVMSLVLKWLRPTVAVAAVVTAVYFITPIKQTIESKNMQITHQVTMPAQKPDRIMYSSSFEKGNQSAQSNHNDSKSDLIAKFDFS